MAFNMKNISGISDTILNEASKAMMTENQKTEFINYDMLIPSELNKNISKNDIEELAEQIYHEGLDQPLVVMQNDDGKYEILGGERRYLAIGQLITSGRYDEEKLVECKVKKPEDTKLPLSTDDKRILTWLTTNQYREKTDGDKYIEALRWKDIILKLRKEGIEMLAIGIDKDGNVIGKNMKGEKTRKLAAEQSNISDSQMQKIESIEAHGTEKLKEALKNDKIKIAGAATIAKLSADDQDRFLEETLQDEKNVITAKHVANFDGNNKKQEIQDDRISVDKGSMIEKISAIIDALKTPNDILLSKKEFEKLNRNLTQISKLLS